MSAYNLEQQKANRDKWTAALRSGRYPQGKRALLSTDDQGRQCFCCLGVACEVAVQAGVIAPPADGSYGGEKNILPTSVQEWLGLYDDAGITRTEHDSTSCLTELNDDAGWTFEQIADLVDGDGVMLQDRR